MVKLSNWVNQTSVYPPNELYAGMPQGKQEKQAITLCESLYKFNFGKDRNVLGDLRQAWREVYVMLKMAESNSINQLYIDKVIDDFLAKAKLAIDAMDACFKQHQAVNQYYQSWRMSYQSVKSEIFMLGK